MEVTQDPTPVEIRQECLWIQGGWTEKERVRRAPWWAEQQAVELRQVEVVELLEAAETMKA